MIQLRQSSGFVWIVFVLFVLLFGFVYVVMMKPVGILYNLNYNQSELSEQVYQDFFIRSKSIWLILPLPILLSMIIWSIIKIQEKDEYGN